MEPGRAAYPHRLRRQHGAHLESGRVRGAAPPGGHTSTVGHGAWSPDGQRILTASDDNTARIWNADGSGEPLLLEGHTSNVWDAAWSPDGQRILTASDDNTARIWNADGSGEPLLLEGHTSYVGHAAWSPDGQRILTASSDKTARIWKADGSGEPLLLEGHTSKVWDAAWSPDGQRLLTGRGVTLPSEELRALRARCDGQLSPVSMTAELRREIAQLAKVSELGSHLRATMREAPMIYDIERCYRDALVTDSKLEGELAIDFVVHRMSWLEPARIGLQPRPRRSPCSSPSGTSSLASNPA